MNRPPVSYVATGEKTSPLFCQAFAKGCGGDICDDHVLRPGPVALFGSLKLWPMLQLAIAEGRDWYYGDHGYLRRKGHFRVTKNGYQHSGRGVADPRRLAELGIEVKEMRKTGEHILLCPPDAAYCSLWGWDADLWEQHQIQEIERFSKRPIVVRRRDTQRPLEYDLVNCWALVTYHSNAAVEALLAGIPVFTFGPSPARAMGCQSLSRIERPLTPTVRDRTNWASILAANQWTMAEIEAGECWRAMR